jgi:hypothetical protein
MRPWWDLDQFFDLPRFVSIQSEIIAGTRQANRVLNPYPLGWYIPLRMPESFRLKHLDKHCIWLDNAKLFPQLVDFCLSLTVFQDVGRIIIMPGPAAEHCDYFEVMDWSDEFLWMQIGDKKFYVLGEDGTKHYVTSTFAFFDSNSVHGSEASEHDAAYSIRVDGVFTDEFKQRAGLTGLRFRT